MKTFVISSLTTNKLHSRNILIKIVNIILDSSYTTTADINYDNIVNILDIIELVNIILSN